MPQRRLRFLPLAILVLGLAAGCAPIASPGPTTAPSSAATQPAAAKSAPQGPTATSAPTTQQPARGGILKIGTVGPLQSLFPFRFVEPTALAAIYDPLIRYDGQLRPQPRLAEKWEFNADKTSISFTLRPDVLFHSGKPMTSEDAAYTYKFLSDPKNSSNIGDYIALVKEVATPDPRTVVFTFKAPTPAALDMFDLFWVIENGATGLETKTAGTGPFIVKEWTPGTTLKLERYPRYWDQGAPLLDGIEYTLLSDTESRMVNLRGGSVDLINAVPAKDTASLTQDGFNAVPSGGGYFDILLNVTYEPLVKPEVRRAISLAVNRQRFAQTILHGSVQPSCIPFPKVSFAYDEMQDKSCAYDPEKAKSLLAEAGYPNGFDSSLLVSGNTPEAVQLAELIRNDLQMVGIKIKINSAEGAAYQKLQREGELQMAIHTFAFSNRDPGSLFLTASVWKADGNSSSYRNPAYKELVAKAATTVDEAQRKALYKQLTQMILDDPFVLVIAPNQRPYAWKKHVNGLSWNADSYLQLDQTWIAR